MGFLEVLFEGIGLAMDASAVGMSNGMEENKMPLKKVLLIAALFGFFQMLMPLIGYFLTGIITVAFKEEFEKISSWVSLSWVSFIILAFLGGKMIFDFIKGCRCKEIETEDGEKVLVCECPNNKLGIGKLCMQAIATSIDALAIGVAMYSEGLVLGVWISTGIIGITTFGMVIGAVYIGKKVGDKWADKAGLLGGIVLVGIGLKLLIQGLL